MKYSFISPDTPLVLASASPRRKDLLDQVRIPFIAAPADIDEDSEEGSPIEICRSLAQKKAVHISGEKGSRWILGADTIVVKDGMVMGKPLNKDEAGLMLKSLSGGPHEVITGFSIVDPSGNVRVCDHVSTTVRVKKLDQSEIHAYIETGEPFGKAGGYGIQGIGAFMIEAIEGSYSNVVGLPLFAVIESLKRIKALKTFPETP